MADVPNWTADDEQTYAELDHAAYEANSRYDLASIAMQSENAAEVAKAKAAAHEAEMIKREEDEEQRALDLADIFNMQSEFKAEKDEVKARIDQIKQDYEFADDNEKETLLDELTEAKEKVKELEQGMADKEKEGDEMMAKHSKERAALKQADKVQAEKDKADAEFNARAGEVVEAFNELGASRDKFQKKMEEKEAELEKARNAEEVDETKVERLVEYVEIYRQQVETLQMNIDNKKFEFDDISAEKQFREDQEKAAAAEKAKEAEYTDLKTTLDEAKLVLDEASYALEDKRFQLEGMDENSQEYQDLFAEIEEEQIELDNLQWEQDNALHAFESVNNELRERQEEARQRQLDA